MSSMTLAQYLDISWLLENEFKAQDREQNRGDGLASESLKTRPIEQLQWWMRKYHHRIQTSHSKVIDEMLRYMLWTIILVMFIIGMGTGRAMLEYGGGDLVNIVGFFVVLIIVPLLFSLMSLLFLLKALFFETERTHLPLPVKLLFDLFGKFSSEMREGIETLYKHERIMQSLAVKLLQYGSISLSFGALLALMVTITTQDIAFGWNTTLDISSETLHQFIVVIALPWSMLFPDAVPSMELITLSHHFRLGNEIAPELIAQAKTLGSWWKFLALSLLVWGVSVRIILALLARYRYEKVLQTSLLRDHDASLLLSYMNESLITTSSPEEHSEVDDIVDASLEALPTGLATDTVVGWNLDKDVLMKILETRGIMADAIFSAGGKNTLEEDDAIIEKVGDTVIVIVKAWEPPMREFLDLLRDMKAKRVSVFPIGSAELGHRARSSDIDIWKMKISSLHLNNIGISREAL